MQRSAVLPDTLTGFIDRASLCDHALLTLQTTLHICADTPPNYGSFCSLPNAAARVVDSIAAKVHRGCAWPLLDGILFTVHILKRT